MCTDNSKINDKSNYMVQILFATPDCESHSFTADGPSLASSLSHVDDFRQADPYSDRCTFTVPVLAPSCAMFVRCSCACCM